MKKIAAQHVRIRKNLSELGSETQKERDLRERYIESLERGETRHFIESARDLEVTGSGDPPPTE